MFNLASKASDVDTDTSIFENKYEHSLYTVNLNIGKAVEQKIKQGCVTDAIKLLYELIGPINTFFENTMVIVENDGVKHNRLSLLKAVTDTALQVCDFTKIVVF